MKKLATFAVLIATAASCVKPDDGGSGDDKAQEAIQALPTKDTLSINVPGGVTKVGDLALSYVLTRTIADTLNGSAAVFLGIVKAISDYPVTSVENGNYVWGPWSDALHPGEYRLVAHVTSDGDIAWAIEGRQKGTQNVFGAVVQGSATPGHPHRGSGSFLLDCDLAHALDPFGGCNDGGQVAIAYDLESSPATVVIDAEHLAPMPDGSQAPQTFHYAYSVAPDGAGSLEFSVFGDTDDPGPAWETTDYVSSWTAGGSGRADISVTGGDLGATSVSASECWDTTYREVYYSDSAGWLPTQGSASACAL